MTFKIQQMGSGWNIYMTEDLYKYKSENIFLTDENSVTMLN